MKKIRREAVAELDLIIEPLCKILMKIFRDEQLIMKYVDSEGYNSKRIFSVTNLAIERTLKSWDVGTR